MIFRAILNNQNGYFSVFFKAKVLGIETLLQKNDTSSINTHLILKYVILFLITDWLILTVYKRNCFLGVFFSCFQRIRMIFK